MKRNGQAAKTPARNRLASNDPLPARMPMGKFLFEYLYRRGVRHSFGVPGNFALRPRKAPLTSSWQWLRLPKRSP